MKSAVRQSIAGYQRIPIIDIVLQMLGRICKYANMRIYAPDELLMFNVFYTLEQISNECVKLILITDRLVTLYPTYTHHTSLK